MADFRSLIPAGEAASGATPLFWEPQPFHPNIVTELRRRSNKNNIGMYNTNDICTNFTPENYWKYKGPMTPWVRCFSNGTGQRNNTSVPVSKYLDRERIGKSYDGFILQGGEGFYKGFGVAYQNKSLVKTDQIIGYQANGEPHILDISKDKQGSFYNISDDKFTPGMLPPPGITRIDVQCVRDVFLSKISINWKCFGLAQLEYMIPFFLTPGINIFLEFGWNLFNIKSLVNLEKLHYDPEHPENDSDAVKLVLRPQTANERIYDSMGNYGCFTGIIWNYNISQRDGVQFDCRTDIISRQNFYAGYIIEKSDKNNNSLGTWITQNLKKISDVLKKIKYVKVNIADAYPIGPSVGASSALKALNESKKIPINDTLNTQEKTTDQLLKEGRDIQKKIDAENDRQKEYERILSRMSTSKEDGGKGITQESLNRKALDNYYNAINPSQFQREIYEQIPELVVKNELNRDKDQQLLDYVNELKEKSNNELKKLKNELKVKTEEILNSTSNFIQYFNALNRNDFSPVKFYGGKPEDRVFIDPNFGFDDNNITVKDKIFEIDKVDDSFKKSSNKYGWVQLDFIFELLNYISNINGFSEAFNINISDTVITAHPNLISCDPDIIIPNARAPKLNIPMPLVTSVKNGSIYNNKGEMLTINKDDYRMLYKENPDKNVIETIIDNVNVNVNTDSYLIEQKGGKDSQIEKFINQISIHKLDDISDKDNLIRRAAKKCKSVFLIQDEIMRDDIDMIVNRYYHAKSGNLNTSVPSLDDIEIKRNDEEDSKRIFKKYNYGYLKYIYISIDKLISLYNSLENKASLKEYAVKILKSVNDASCNYWDLDIVADDKGQLMIVDKGLGYDKEQPIYCFEIGTTNSPVKKFSFNVNLTNEQTVQVLYSSGANINTREDKKIDTSAATCAEVKEKNLPAFSYRDRINEYISQKQSQLNKTEINNDTIYLKNYNEDICLLQTSYNVPGTNIVRLRKQGTELLDFVCLNVSSNLKKYVKDILYTPLVVNESDIETKQNIDEDNGYTSPADNFTVNLTFDGIMGFRMLEYFAIENLPKPYNKENVIFVINEVRHSISKQGWETTVTAMLRGIQNQVFKYITI